MACNSQNHSWMDGSVSARGYDIGGEDFGMIRELAGLTSLPNVVSNTWGCGVTALRVNFSSTRAWLGTSFSKRPSVSFRASLAAALLLSIGVFRNRMS